MKRKAECCCQTPVKEGTVTELPEQIQAELDAMGGLPALEKRLPSAKILEERGRIYQALSDPIRLSILYIIREKPLCVCVINRFMRLSGSKLSYHLTILKESRLIEGEYDGNWIIYSITERGSRLLQCTEHAGKK
jgi:ArsR family transcriptional regulator, arsenate/arsenite/antimonite-responsive transcriptional repressor